MNRRSIINAALLTILFFSTLSTFAQNGLIVDSTLVDSQLVKLFVGSGVQISNISVNCTGVAYGFFDGTNCNVGIDSGLILTSGSATNAIGPNDQSGVSGYNGTNGDPDLDNLIPGFTTKDACIIEFDITPLSDTLSFDYVFGSDEYLEYVNSSFNDVFGFFISGPGIIGSQNIALLPSTAIPVSINNVNDVSNNTYYINNGDGSTSPQNTNPSFIQYDGFTTVLTARALVQPCQTYHLKLAVADAGDFALDSGVFLKAGSLSSPGIKLSVSSTAGNGFTNAIEGCIDGIITFKSSKILTVPQILHFSINGVAIPGTDYVALPDSVIIPAGSDSVQLFIIPYDDQLIEGMEDIRIILHDPCFNTPVDSAVIYIEDHIKAITSADTSICLGDTIQLFASGASGYSWNNGYSLSDTSIADPMAYPDSSTLYQVIVSNQYACIDTGFIKVNVIQPYVFAGNDTSISLGSSLILKPVGNGNSWLWSPPDWLDNPFIASPLCTPQDTITYYLTMTTSEGCITNDSIRINILAEPLIFVPNAFTPNGDLHNDRFGPFVKGYVEFTDFSIYNRWGQRVFLDSDKALLNNPDLGWDGTFKSKNQESGVYTYLFRGIDVYGNKILVSGNVTLIR